MPSSTTVGVPGGWLREAALPGTVHHGAQAVGDEQHCTLRKPAPQGGLHLQLCPRVHGGCGLIQDQDLGFPEEGTCQTQELLLAHTGNECECQARCFVCLHFRICRTCPQMGPYNSPTVISVGPQSTELVGISILPFLRQVIQTRVSQFPHL